MSNSVDMKRVAEIILTSLNYSPVRGKVVNAPQTGSSVTEYITFRKPSDELVIIK